MPTTVQNDWPTKEISLCKIDSESFSGNTRLTVIVIHILTDPQLTIRDSEWIQNSHDLTISPEVVWRQGIQSRHCITSARICAGTAHLLKKLLYCNRFHSICSIKTRDYQTMGIWTHGGNSVDRRSNDYSLWRDNTWSRTSSANRRENREIPILR